MECYYFYLDKRFRGFRGSGTLQRGLFPSLISKQCSPAEEINSIPLSNRPPPLFIAINQFLKCCDHETHVKNVMFLTISWTNIGISWTTIANTRMISCEVYIMFNHVQSLLYTFFPFPVLITTMS